MTAPTRRPAGKPGSMLTQKFGPLPLWVWMALGLLIALAYSVWQKNRTASSSTTTTGTTTTPDQTPPYIIQNYVTGTPGSVPPVGGRRPKPPPSNNPTGDQPQYATVMPGWVVSEWVNDIAAHGPSPVGTPGSEGPHPGFTQDVFMSLNPNAASNIQGGKFVKAFTYRIK